MLFGSVVLIVWTHKSRSPKTPMLWYCPVAFLMTTWAQYENALWGFQIAWYMVLICLMGAMAVLNRRHVGPLSLAIAAGIAVIGSYSSLQGLLIWPAGLVLLAYHRRSWRLLTAWVVAAMATTGLYMYHLDSSPLSYYRIDPLAHPVFAAKLFSFRWETWPGNRSRSRPSRFRLTAILFWAPRAPGLSSSAFSSSLPG